MVFRPSASHSDKAMREEIRELARMGPLPSYKVGLRPDQREKIERYDLLILSIRKPVTDEEARVLVSLFGPDDCFEMEEQLVHLIESAPGWPLWDCLEDTDNEWIQRLVHRQENGGFMRPPKRNSPASM
jgi:hypothetical protein